MKPGIPVLPALLLASTLSSYSIAISADGNTASSDTEPVKVEEVVVTPAPTSGDKAGELWDKTKQETGEAASAAAEFSKEQGKKIVKGTKQGVEKGTDVVVTGSKKAWDATKTTTKKAAKATATALENTGQAINKALENNEQDAPVTDKSVNTSSGG